MKKPSFPKPKTKKTPIGKAFEMTKGEMPKGPKGPEAMRQTPAAPPFGRSKKTRGMFSPTF